MGRAIIRTFLIRLAATPGAIAEATAFQRRHLTEHLWPRTHEEFIALAAAGALYLVYETVGGGEELIGLCYIKHGDDGHPDEFGGVYLLETYRGLGLAQALGKLAISNHFAWDPPRYGLIAHVHEDNLLPRSLLQRDLGFVFKRKIEVPDGAAPPSMRRNVEGRVVGDEFGFEVSYLMGFAEWLDAFSGSIEGKAGAANLRMDMFLAGPAKADALLALREIARQR